jgi:hypothetical protein
MMIEHFGAKTAHVGDAPEIVGTRRYLAKDARPSSV